jgi:5,10-methylenetetrahydromethanopterin reductase
MMRFGIGLTPVDEHDENVRLGVLAETLGYDVVWVPDERFFRDCYVTMAAIAEGTTRVRMGPCVTDPYTRHPALTAAAMGTLDELAGGRGILGIGAGASGFDAMGIARERPAAAIREAVALIRRLWAGERVTQEGQIVRFHAGALDFPARASIPVYIAGRGPKILELAGEVADGVIIGALASPPTFEYAMRHIRRGAARTGRGLEGFETMLWLHTALSPDAAQARDAVRKIVVGVLVSSLPVLDELGVAVPEPLRRELATVTYGAHSESMARAAEGVPDDVLAHFTMAGDAAACVERVAALERQGVTQVAVLPWRVPGQTLERFITDFARDVIAPYRGSRPEVPQTKHP